MVKAKDMVELAKKFSSAQSKDEDQQNGDFRDLMISMGIANPVTKYPSYLIYFKFYYI